MYPDSIERAANGIGGRGGTPTRRPDSVSTRAPNAIGGNTHTRRPENTARAQSVAVRVSPAPRRPDGTN